MRKYSTFNSNIHHDISSSFREINRRRHDLDIQSIRRKAEAIRAKEELDAVKKKYVYDNYNGIDKILKEIDADFGPFCSGKFGYDYPDIFRQEGAIRREAESHRKVIEAYANRIRKASTLNDADKEFSKMEVYHLKTFPKFVKALDELSAEAFQLKLQNLVKSQENQKHEQENINENKTAERIETLEQQNQQLQQQLATVMQQMSILQLDKSRDQDNVSNVSDISYQKIDMSEMLENEIKEQKDVSSNIPPTTNTSLRNIPSSEEGFSELEYPDSQQEIRNSK